MQKPDFGFIPPNIKEERWKVRDQYWKNAPSADKRRRYKYLRSRITKDLWKAGVPLMAGSDSPEWFLAQGFSIHDELKTFVDAGLTPFAVLETATKNPATYLGIYNRVGSVEAGKEADLLLLDKNPLDDISNTKSISGLMINGKWFDKQRIDQLLGSAKSTLNQ
jgi:imidazolonepropionase-like amidohydrolase